jgi:hypothetical protein
MVVKYPLGVGGTECLFNIVIKKKHTPVKKKNTVLKRRTQREKEEHSVKKKNTV